MAPGGCHGVVGVEVSHVEAVPVAGKSGGEHLEDRHDDAGVVRVNHKFGPKI